MLIGRPEVPGVIEILKCLIIPALFMLTIYQIQVDFKELACVSFIAIFTINSILSGKSHTMKKYFISLFIGLSLISSISNAQVLEQTDSIYQALLCTPGATNIIQTLHRSIDNLMYQNPVAAIHYTKEQIRISNEMGYK